jgi:hypothetical protein
MQQSHRNNIVVQAEDCARRLFYSRLPNILVSDFYNEKEGTEGPIEAVRYFNTQLATSTDFSLCPPRLGTNSTSSVTPSMINHCSPYREFKRATNHGGGI